MVFLSVFCLFSTGFKGSQGAKILGVFEGFLGVFEKTKEKKDKGFPSLGVCKGSLASQIPDKRPQIPGELSRIPFSFAWTVEVYRKVISSFAILMVRLLEARVGEGRARTGRGTRRGRARTGERENVRGRGRKTLVFGGYESLNRAK